MRSGAVILIFFLLVSVYLQAQKANDGGEQIQQIPAEGILLDKGWKFQAGDNPEWAKPEFDDKDWLIININKPAAHFMPISKRNISWLRLHFAIGASVQDSLMALLIEQFGASEIYLDGRLVRRLGKINSPKEFTAFNPHNKPIPIHINKAPEHILAVRFAGVFPSSGWALQRSNVAPLSIRLQSLSTAFSDREVNQKKLRFDVGITYINAAFGLLFLLLFMFYPRQRLNLFFSLFTILLVVNFAIATFLQEGQYSLDEQVKIIYASRLIDRLIGINILLFMLHALFNRVRPFFFWYIIILLVDFLFNVILPVQYQVISTVLRGSFILLCLWIIFQAFRSKNKEAWLIGLVASAVVLVNLSFVLLGLTGIDITRYAVLIVPFVITISMLTYLALRFARTNTSLEQQLMHVKNLSEENIQKEKEKQQILASRKENLEQQVTQRTAELKQSLEELKATQTQLVQREKMASLGELTAGIAHEIQNPLNFVNNFSEINAELISELKQEVQTGNTQGVIRLADEIEENEQKIGHHGKRADAIVKGMLQHSRASTGEKQPTDINALSDEYLRLSYHGIRVKEKGFTAVLQTHYDNSIEKVNVDPQDLGRVLLNLFHNAFYAMSEKKKQLNGTYEPIIKITTKEANGRVEISIRDNGVGIPQRIIDRIFQPFFTTKPTGEGTGLGLSLSYDIITKGHCGELKVNTKEGEYAEFVVKLPV